MLEERGLSVGGEYVAEYSAVFDGGLERDGAFRNLLTIDATLDLGVAFGLEGGTVFAQYLSVNAERGGTLDAGDIQIYSNIENDRSLDVLYELWYEQRLFEDRLRLKVGKIDANSEFNYVDAAGEFSNSSAGFSPTIVGFASYPDPATSVNLFYTFGDTKALAFTLGYGLYDGAAGADGEPTGRLGPATFFSDDRSDDYAHYAQGELAWDAIGDGGAWWGAGRATVGGWWHTGAFERFDGGVEEGIGGLWVTAEQRVYDSGRTEDAGVYVFGQYAWSDEAVSDFAQHFGTGLVVRGTLPGRDRDSAGLYLTLADLSDETGAGFDDDELVIDAYYRVHVTPAVFVQPELQYIVNPAGDASIDDAFVGAVRIGIVF